MDDSIQELRAKKVSSPEAAYEKATEKGRFAGLLAAPPDELS